MAIEILLSQGLVALVDEEDAWATEFKWSADRDSRTVYAVRSVWDGARSRRVALHREILKAPPGAMVDHVNGNGLDCRRANLRLASRDQNNKNVRKRHSNTSGYKGVSWHAQDRLWRARIAVNKRNVSLGTYRTVEEAARAYDAAARRYHGEFARTNFEAES